MTRHRPRLWQVFTGLSILIGALVVFAWQQGGSGGAGGPLNAIAKAAEKTQSQPGGRMTMRAVVSSPGRPAPLTVTGEGAFDSRERARAVLRFPSPDSGDQVTMDMVSDGNVVYMRSSVFGALPDGRKWMSLDVALGDEVEMPAPAEGNANGELELLEAASGDVDEIGKEDVRGVSTTYYRGTISVSEQVKRLREEGADELASVAEEHGSPARFEVWIDADGLVRRMRLVQAHADDKGGASTTIDMRMDLFDLGIDPEIAVPDSSEVFDATSLAKEELEGTGNG
jgi:hypothetical protein